MALAFAASIWAVASVSLLAFVVLAVLIDAALQVNQTLSRLVIFGAAAEVRGRVNSIYMSTLFAGGAVGSTLGSVAYRWGGWPLTAGTGTLLAAAVVGLAWHHRTVDQENL